MSPQVDVVGLGPAGPELVTGGALRLLEGGGSVLLRTGIHPAAGALPRARTFDHHYEEQPTFEAVYLAIADDLVDEARRTGSVVYGVPGSPTVAEASVAELVRHAAVLSGEVTVRVHPAVSFVDLACARLGVDPVASGMRLVDAESFAIDAAGERGPLLVAQCWSRAVLSGVKLSVEAPDPPPVTVLWHLGIDDERIWEIPWEGLDRSFDPDHLTSLWIPRLAAPVATELVRLDELVHTLRRKCPWDREQTHGSLARHLLEESYEVLEAIDAVAAADAGTPAGGTDADTTVPGAAERAVALLEEELGDLLFQVYFHALLAAEAGRFTLADVARGVHDKLVDRHPHVFGGVQAGTPGEVAANWEVSKLAEKDRTSVTEGIPAALPALALAAKLQRKALAVGMALPSVAQEAVRIAEGVARLAGGRDGDAGAGAGDHVADGQGGRPDRGAEIGSLLFSLASVARSLGIDPETALRTRDADFRRSVEAHG